MFRETKSIYIVVLAFIILLSSAACARSDNAAEGGALEDEPLNDGGPPPVRGMRDTEYVDFETVADTCTDILVAVYSDKKTYEVFSSDTSQEYYTEYEFTIDKNIKGETTAESIYVFETDDAAYGHSVGKRGFSAGTSGSYSRNKV